jgi:hypothetical protein
MFNQVIGEAEVTNATDVPEALCSFHLSNGDTAFGRAILIRGRMLLRNFSSSLRLSLPKEKPGLQSMESPACPQRSLRRAGLLSTRPLLLDKLPVTFPILCDIALQLDRRSTASASPSLQLVPDRLPRDWGVLPHIDAYVAARRVGRLLESTVAVSVEVPRAVH